MSSNDTAIKVDNLVKTFKIPVEAHSGIKQKIINQLKGRKGYRDFTPLKGVSFEIKKGEFFGIVGRNGSGKSTLLKSIAGIYNPNSGGVTVDGMLVPFIELGVGFNPELTGRENVYLNGALLGFGRKEMEAMYGEIVDFAELHDFMEEKLKNYSSGMQVRLAFSIAIRAKGDILLLDEVLAVGDEAFQRKCYEYFGKLKRERKTVVLVTHSMSNIEQFCDKALLIDEGSIKKIGSNMEVAQAYRELFDKDYRERILKSDKSKVGINSDSEQLSGINVRIQQSGENTVQPENDQPFDIVIEFTSNHEFKEAVVGMNVVDSLNNIVYGTSTKRDTLFTITKGKNIATFTLPNVFANGMFSVNAAIGYDYSAGTPLLFKDIDLARFTVSGRDSFERGAVSIAGVETKVSHGSDK